MNEQYKKHAHQRQVFYALESFLQNPPESCKIAVLTGIRRIGKTGVLTDLTFTLPNALYVNFGRNSDIVSEQKKCLEFLKTGEGTLLIDEITHFPDYETLVEHIESRVYESDLHVVFTGSSALHLLTLKSGLLGAGRAKLFRMSFLSFSEYLVFTGKKNSYSFIDDTDLNVDDFKNYLQLKNLPAEGLKISFDADYMYELYKDIELSNKSSRNPGAFSDITADNVQSVLDLVAYTLRNKVSWENFNNPSGLKELAPLGITDIDKKSMRIYLTAKQLKEIVPKNIARALYYLIAANLAYVEVRHEDTGKVSASKLADMLFDVTTREELKQLFDEHNICLVSPLWYMRIAKEIIEPYGCTPSKLLDTKVIGDVLENYAKGAYCVWQSLYEYEIADIGNTQNARTNEEKSQSQEVDICDINKKVLCEITAHKKKSNLNRHFIGCDFIRILATKDEERHDGIHKIPYPKLCAMIDSGEIFKLERSDGTGLIV